MATISTRRLSRRSFVQSLGAGALVAGAAATTRFLPASGQAPARPTGGQSQSSGTPLPQWDSTFRSALGTQAMGYVWAVAQNGRPVAGAGVNLSRSANEATNPGQSWTLDTLVNIYSASKAISAVGFIGLVAQQGAQLLDQPFWPILANSGRFAGTPATGVETITIRQLLTHYSGFNLDAFAELFTPSGQSVDQFLMQFLEQPLANKPGSTYGYNNQNFTVIQVLYEILSGASAGAYTQLIKDNVLTPMGIDTTQELTDTRDPSNEALGYSGPTDTRPGRLEAPVPLMAAGGWLGTANGVLKFLLGLRANAVLDAPTTQMMYTQQLGWFADSSPYGSYYHKTGGEWDYTDAAHTQPPQETHAGIAVLPDGYDAVLLVNSAAGTPRTLSAVELIAKASGAPAPLRD
jgi:CubicO group peptidase (beta-lactamase class C family)